MDLNIMSSSILKGYDSLPLGVKTVRVNKAFYNHKGRNYRFKEYAFEFPYYLDDDDLFMIGKVMKELEINATYGKNLLERLEFHGHIHPVSHLFDFSSRRIWHTTPYSQCKLFIQRCPIECLKSKELGYTFVYTRFTTVIKKEKHLAIDKEVGHVVNDS